MTEDEAVFNNTKYKVLGVVYSGHTPIQPNGEYPTIHVLSKTFPDALIIHKLIEEYAISSVISLKDGATIQQCYFAVDEDHGEHCICSDPNIILK